MREERQGGREEGGRDGVSGKVSGRENFIVQRAQDAK